MNNGKRNILSSLFNKDKTIKILKESFLPGMIPAKKSLFTEEFENIDKHLKTQDVKEGAYVCSCGKFYIIEPCGFPTKIDKCNTIIS